MARVGSGEHDLDAGPASWTLQDFKGTTGAFRSSPHDVKAKAARTTDTLAAGDHGGWKTRTLVLDHQPDSVSTGGFDDHPERHSLGGVSEHVGEQHVDHTLDIISWQSNCPAVRDDV
jgi:hypothetical protein